MFISNNPYTNTHLKIYELLSSEQLNLKLQNTVNAQPTWQEIPLKERLIYIENIGKLLLKHADELAKLASAEIGKPVSQAKAEVLKCATVCSYYLNEAEKQLAPQLENTEKGLVKLLFEPMGVILGIFPWNFPYWQIIRSAIPVITSGNTMLIKPAPNMPQCALALQDIINNSGLPEHVLQTVMINEEQIARLIANDNIAGVTLTGSDAAGSKVAEIAGRNIKKTVLELGGSDPLIILNDADLDKHIPEIALARLQNNGQSCVASKRFLVQKDIKDAFLNKLVEHLQTLKIGDPQLPETQVGPLARIDLKVKLEQQVKISVQMGANIFWQMPHNVTSPCFYAPLILTDIPDDAPAATEELFGPVFSIFSFNDINEAIAIANNSPYGLGASIFSQNNDIAMHIAEKLKCGIVSINKMVKSDARFPFGGVKKSGIGKELGSYGLKEFVNLKTVML
ncbi:MAG: aldehyde dehydrogenase family protein [Bacteroidia bacterium]